MEIRGLTRKELEDMGISIVPDRKCEWQYKIIKTTTYTSTIDGKTYSVKRELRPSIATTKTGKKFWNLCLSIGGSGKTCTLHRLVYAYFKGILPANNYVDHKDGNALNNDLENLQLRCKYPYVKEDGTLVLLF